MYDRVIQSLSKCLGHLFVAQRDETEEIELYIQALLNREWNLSINSERDNVIG